jgi:hypothetical protein
MPELICKILHISKTTYYSYLKKGYPVISFLNSFGKEGLEELLETGKIEKLEQINNFKSLEAESIRLYVDFTQNLSNEEQELFLLICYQTQKDFKDINQYYIDLILDANLKKDVKVSILKKLQNISNNNTLFFYGIKQLIQNHFKQYYSHSIYSDKIEDSEKKDIKLKIKHLQIYIKVFLQKDFIEYDDFQEKIKMIEKRPSYINLIDYDYAYFNYLYNIVFGKDGCDYKSTNFIEFIKKIEL